MSVLISLLPEGYQGLYDSRRFQEKELCMSFWTQGLEIVLTNLRAGESG